MMNRGIEDAQAKSKEVRFHEFVKPKFDRPKFGHDRLGARPRAIPVARTPHTGPGRVAWRPHGEPNAPPTRWWSSARDRPRARDGPSGVNRPDLSARLAGDQPTRGRRIRKVAPRPGWLSTSIVPPWPATMLWLIASPCHRSWVATAGVPEGRGLLHSPSRRRAVSRGNVPRERLPTVTDASPANRPIPSARSYQKVGDSGRFTGTGLSSAPDRRADVSHPG